MSGSDKKPPRRPVGGSRPMSSSPRKIAGRSGRPEEPSQEAPSQEAPKQQAPEQELTPPPPPVSLSKPAPPVAAPLAEPTYVIEPGAETPTALDGVLARPRTTVVLAALLAGLLAIAAVLGGFVVDDDGGWYGVGGNDETSESVAWRYEVDEEFDLPDHPITVPFVDARNAGEAATNAVVDILTVKWDSYDEHFEAVQSRMTEEFAEKYTELAGDTREKFLSTKAEYQWEVVGQSVTSASDTEVTALLFLNQYVFKGEGADRTGPDVHQVRVIVTAVAEGDEWLIDDLDAL